MLSRREVDRKVSLQSKGYPPNPTLRGARMFAIASIVIALVLVFGAVLVRRAKIERTSFNQRFDAYTKR
jgi:hypothetical protein